MQLVSLLNAASLNIVPVAHINIFKEMFYYATYH